MDFGNFFKFLAQNLLVACFAFGGMFALPSLPNQSLLADEASFEAVVIPETPLLNPVVVTADGLVLEISENVEETVTSGSSFESSKTEGFLWNTFEKISVSEASAPEPRGERVVKIDVRRERMAASHVIFLSSATRTNFSNGMGRAYDSSVKSVAVQGLFGFLGICPNRSDLPSRSFSMPCESSPSKSMTTRFANDWKYSWQPARMIYLLRQSISSSWIPKTLTPSSSPNLTLSMSDISSTWSNGTVDCLQISSQALSLDRVRQTIRVERRNRPESLVQNLPPGLLNLSKNRA